MDDTRSCSSVWRARYQLWIDSSKGWEMEGFYDTQDFAEARLCYLRNRVTISSYHIVEVLTPL